MKDISPDRLLADLRTLSRIGGRPDGGLDRLAWTPADLEGRQWLAERMRQSGLEVRTDPVLNVFGHLPGSSGPWLLVGSHCDSVPQGGRLDGAYGTVAALEVLRTLVEAEDPLASRVEVVGFADEEGVRFDAGVFGSRALAGELDLNRLRGLKDWQGTPVPEVLGGAGVDLERVLDARQHLAQVSAFLELHIEQGPRLEAAGVDLAVVTGIVGIHRQRVRILGMQNHAGTTPFNLRKDAGRAAARVAAGLRELVQAVDAEAVANIGVMSFDPGGINVVPGSADFDLEIRHLEEEVIKRIVTAFDERLKAICEEEGCRGEVEVRSDVPPAAMAPTVILAVERACADLARRWVRMVSGAGHDAGVLSRHVPTGMLFVPSRGGVSHSPLEDTSAEHLVLGTRALLRAVRQVLAAHANR